MVTKRRRTSNVGKAFTKRVKADKCADCPKVCHSDCYDPLCNKFIPIEDRPRLTTVPLSLSGRLYEPYHKGVLQTACSRFSKLAYRVHLLALGHMTRCLDEGIYPIPVIDKPYLRTLFNVCKTSIMPPRTNGPSVVLLQCYRELFENIAKVDGTGLSGIIDANIGDMVTDFNAYDETGIMDNCKVWLVARYGIKKGCASAVVNKIMLQNGIFETLPNSMFVDPSARSQQEQVAIWNNRVAEIRDTIQNARDDGWLLSLRHEWMNEIDQVNAELQVQGTPFQYASFRLLPKRKLGTKFVTIDRKALLGLRALSKQYLRESNDLELYDEDAHLDLDAFFNRDGITQVAEAGGQQRTSNPSKNPCRWRLSSCIRTNGVELHVLFERINMRRTEQGRLRKLTRPEIRRDCDIELSTSVDRFKWFDDTTPERAALLPIKPGEITVVDPGVNTPVNVGYLEMDDNGVPVRRESDGATQFKFQSFSQATWKQRTKQVKVHKRELRDRRDNRLNEDQVFAILAANALTSPHWAAMRASIRTHLYYADRLHHVYSNKQRLKLKQEARIARNREIDKAITFIRGPRKAKFVAFGNGSRMSGIKGTSNGFPHKVIKRKARQRARNEGWHIVEVDEFNTSAKACCCVGHENKSIKTGHRILENGHRARVHGIVRCTNCAKLWNRDDAACINIWAVTVALLKRLDRPFWLARQQQQQQNAPHTQATLEAYLGALLVR